MAPCSPPLCLLPVLYQVLLCEETVSLLGIRQFYKLVRDPSASDSRAGSISSPSAANGTSSSHQGAAADAEAPTLTELADGTHSTVAMPKQQQQQQQSGVQQVSADQPEPQLSIAEQQQLLVLKVEALLQLLSSASFHQAVVFCNRKPSAEWLARRLTAAGCPSAHLSSDLPQTEVCASGDYTAQLCPGICARAQGASTAGATA